MAVAARAHPADWRLGDERAAALGALGLVALAGAVLRFAAFGAVPADPFYDAAVRSMGTSWHDFLFGAFEPGGTVAVDKPAGALWLPVIAAKLLGFGSVSVRLPEAIAGTLAVLLLYDIVRRGFGRAAGVAAAAALAVLPVAVLTDRSDTMDSLATALVLLAVWVTVWGAGANRTWPLPAAGAVMGLAFNVKLVEPLVALPALALLMWMTLDRPRLDRLGHLAVAGVAFAAVALSWAAVVSAAPGRHPFPVGSTDGSVWSVMLGFDGLGRLSRPAAHPLGPNAPGLGRLFGAPDVHYGRLLAGELVAGLLLGVLALASAPRAGATGRPRDAGRPRIATGLAAFAAVWWLTGYAVFSHLAHLATRYVEAFAPAVAAVLGIAVAGLGAAAARRPAVGVVLGAGAAAAAILGVLAARSGGTAAAVALAAGTAAAALGIAGAAARRRADPRGLAALLTLAALAAVLALPAGESIALVRSGREDSGTPGAMPARELAALSAYLRRHSRRTRYEVASAAATRAAALIARDGRPVLVLNTVAGQQVVRPRRLARAVRRGRVRYLLAGAARCARGVGFRRACDPVMVWAKRHAVNVSRAAGLHPRRTARRHPGQAVLLYRLTTRARPHRGHGARLHRLTTRRRPHRGHAARLHPLTTRARPHPGHAARLHRLTTRARRALRPAPRRGPRRSRRSPGSPRARPAAPRRRSSAP